jgi:DNA gyrase subunit A
LQELFKLVPAPDFPTGGLIMGASGAQKLYKTGHGSVIMRAKCHIEIISGAMTAKGSSKSRNAIVVTELPYMTNKAGELGEDEIG